jgi:hypothetical protein
LTPSEHVNGAYDEDITHTEVWQEKILDQGLEPKDVFPFTDCTDGAAVKFKKQVNPKTASPTFYC